MSKELFRTTPANITTAAVVLSLIGILLVSTPVLAQTGSGVIRGVVRDANQAVVPGAAITATNDLTNVTHKTQSNEVGIYYLGSVPRGSYTLTTELTGFKKWSSKVELQVGQTAVVDVGLELGSVETVIDVVSAVAPITTESVEVSDVKDYQRIRQLPLNGRDVANLFNLTPGVEGGGNARVNGLKVGSLEITQDGASLVDRFGGGIARIRPGLDTIQEFRIETVGSSAQYAQPATVTLVTRSGTNEFHGSVFETHRNNAAGLRARQRQDGETSAKLIRNEYGASAGGRIIRDKTFFFAAYEANKQRQTSFNSRSQQRVPTDAIWSGDFSGLVDIDGNKYTIYDPLTTDANGVRQPFPNNRIPENRISPFYKKLRTLTAQPTNSNNPFQGPNIERFYPIKGDQYSYSGKVDHKFTDKDNLSVRYTRSNRIAGTLGGVYGNPVDGLVDAFGSQQSITKIHTTAIQYNHIFSPTFLNELVASSHRSSHQSGTRADDTNWPDALGFPNPFGATGWPTFYSGPDAGTSSYFDWDGDNRGDQKLTSHVAEDNLTWIKGKHSLKFGGKVRYEYDNVRELQQAQGSHDFSPNWTALYDRVNDDFTPFTGSGSAEMALGLFSVIRNNYNRGYYYFEQQEIGLYVHDNWKVTPRLTLDLGVRWDNWRPYEEKYNRLVNVDIDNFANRFEVITPKNVRMEDMPGIPSGVLSAYRARGLTWKTADEAGFPTDLYNPDNNNFGPRLGAAFRITDKTVLRGGYGEYFWTMPLSQILQGSRTNAPLNLRYVNNFSNPTGTDPLYALKNVPSEGVYVGKAAIDLATGSVAPGAQSFRAQDARGWKDGRAQSWHLTLEREVLPNTALRLSYIGDHGGDLEQNLLLNGQVEYSYVARTKLAPPGNRDLMRVNKDWEFSGTKTRTGYSNTNSFQAELERRYSSGMAFQVFYTFTRSLTTSDAGGFTSGGAPANANDTSGQGGIPENIHFFGEPSLSYDDRLRVLYHNSSAIPGHRVRYNGIFDLPFGKGKKWGSDLSGAANQILGGWQVATIGDWRGGLWGSVDGARFLQGDPTLSADERSVITFQGRPQRIWFKGDFSLTPDDRSQRVLRPLGPNFNNSVPLVLANGTTRLTPLTNIVNPNARGFYQGPGAWNVDFSLFKNFRINESMNVRFTADFFNVFNHPNDNGPGQSGFNVTTGLQDLSTQQNEPRIIQFSLRFDF
jgi:hypothetical protein